ncbi:sugar kinase [Roseivivax sp. CAU 1761]
MSGGVLTVGECMVELAEAGDGLYRRGFAGDTFNTAWYARRLLGPDMPVAFGSVIGSDAISDEMAAFLAAEGIATDALRRDPERTLGLYMIALRDGERSFSYWRGQSAARRLAEDGDWLDAICAGRSLIHVSGITLAILSPEGRARLIAALGRARRAGTRISFDTNLRPRLWEDEAAMRAGLEAGAGAADIVLPSFDEEQGLFGDETPGETVARYRDCGAAEVVVKNGAGAVTLWDAAGGEREIAPEPVDRIVDTTAAGDSFAAGYLAALFQGAAPDAGVRRGARLAGRVIGARGALVAEALDD